MAEKILIVEDNTDARQMLAELLGMEGFGVITAENGRVGLEVAKAEHPAIIITDLNMPEGDGIQMIQDLRKSPRMSDVAIIVMTGYGDWNETLAQNAGLMPL
jgi:DNA-binding response OmpR family regulator